MLGTRGVWSPARLFANGEKGAFYDPYDLANLKQLSTGATAVTSTSDPVGYLRDLSPNGNHAIQATTTKRFAVGQNGPGYYLYGDHTDDYLRATFSIPQPWTRVSMVDQRTWTNINNVFAGVSANGGRLTQTPAAPKLQCFSGTALVLDHTIIGAVDQAAVPTVLASPQIITEFANGASSGISANFDDFRLGDAGTVDPAGITMLANQNGDNFFGDARLYRMLMISRALTAVELQLVKKWILAPWSLVVVEGDSLSASSASSLNTGGYTYEAIPLVTVPSLDVNHAIGGSRLETNSGDLVFRTAAADRALAAKSAGKSAAFYCWIGHNDVDALVNSTLRNQWIADYTAYLLARRAAGASRIFVGNLISRKDAGSPNANINRPFVNPLIATMCSTNGFTLVDYNSTIFGIDATADDTNYYLADKIHPDQSKAVPLGILRDTFAAALNS